MTRPNRFTIRLADREIRTVREFAEAHRLVPSAAVRWLIKVGLAAERASHGADSEQPFTGPQQTI